MGERRVPAPSVDAGNPDAPRCQIKRRLAAHADAGGQILIGAHAARGPGIDQHDVERCEHVADAFQFRLDLGGTDNVSVG